MTSHAPTPAVCPCGTGEPYGTCCGPLHAGGVAATAEALMRSRYCAFARRDAAYLVRTSHPMERAKIRPGAFRHAFSLTWTGLEVVGTARGAAGDSDGVVRFRAHFTDGGRPGVLDETSRFSRAQGEWVYRDGKGVLPVSA